jgi:hypothetical protein
MAGRIGVGNRLSRLPRKTTPRSRLVRGWLRLILLLPQSRPSSDLGSSSEPDLGVAFQGDERRLVLGRTFRDTIGRAGRAGWRRSARGVLVLVVRVPLFSGGLVQRVPDFGSAFEDAPLSMIGNDVSLTYEAT